MRPAYSRAATLGHLEYWALYSADGSRNPLPLMSGPMFSFVVKSTHECSYYVAYGSIGAQDSQAIPYEWGYDVFARGALHTSVHEFHFSMV